jgi:hypothetical protein
VSFPLQLQRTVAINGLHSTPTGDLPRLLTSRRPRPIKGTLEHHLHTTFPFLTSSRSIRYRMALPSSSVVADLSPTVVGSPPAVHRPASHSVRTNPLPLPLGPLTASSLGRDRSCAEALVSPWHRAVVSPCGPIECCGPQDLWTRSTISYSKNNSAVIHFPTIFPLGCWISNSKCRSALALQFYT